MKLERRASNLMTVVNSLTRLAGTYADGMTVGEAPWVLSLEHVSVAVQALAPRTLRPKPSAPMPPRKFWGFQMKCMS